MILPSPMSPLLDCLIIDSHDQDVENLAQILGEQGYSIRTAVNSFEALRALDFKLADLIFLEASEYQNPNFKLELFLNFYQQKKQNIIIFLLISSADHCYSIPLEQGFQFDYLRKPFYPEAVILRVKNILHSYHNQKVVAELRLLLNQEIVTRREAERQLQQINEKLQTTTEQLHHLSRFDPLTQLANRPYFEEYLLREWQRLARERIPLSLIIGDVDQFQGYNEVYGYSQGDICLQTLAQTMNACIKRPADLVARYSGEEFTLLLPHTASSGAIEVAKLVRSQINQLKISHPKSTISSYLTLSFGVATAIPLSDLPPDPLITVAEEALQEAKRQGGDRIGVGVHWR